MDKMEGEDFMKIATILPIPHLHIEIDSSYHLCLAHLMHISEYRDFFATRTTRQGNYVIMDNGVVETGVPMPIQKLIDIAYDCRIDELIMPDQIWDMKETLKLGKDAVHTTLKNRMNLNIMAVPQGNSPEEWKKCLKEMLQWPIHTIGISKFVCKYFYNRVEALSIADDLIYSDKDIHLLGCASDPYEVFQVESIFPGRVRGVDSGIAAMYTQAGKDMMRVPIRPKIEMDFNAYLDPAKLSINVNWWKARALKGIHFGEVTE